MRSIISNTSKLRKDIHYRVLAMVEANPAITQRALAASLGVSLGRINYGLRALIDKGLIKVSNFKKSETKLTYAYLLTPSGVREKSALTKAFLASKMEEFDALKAEIIALQAQAGVNHSSTVENEHYQVDE
ncbi:MarR family EPS-associated transcriptional regulator [Methylophilaceae bacterium]|nr:MarR family EPS-associated transcriptional regulator [Methylophilaceae bacterium]